MDFPRGDLMFRPVMTKTGKPVEFQFEGEIITAIDGDNVAAAPVSYTHLTLPTILRV